MKIVCLHGFGVRGFYWEPLLDTLLNQKPFQLLPPDLDFATPETAFVSAVEMVQQENEPVYLMGHSLGGALAAIVAQELGPEIVPKVAILAAPYGSTPGSPFVRQILAFLLHHDWLLPDFLTRAQFFTKATPKAQQQQLWHRTVKEAPGLIDALVEDEFPFTSRITKPLPQGFDNSLVVAAGADKTVSLDRVKALAEILHAPLQVMENAGHNDLIYAPGFRTRLESLLFNFFSQH